MAAALKEIKPFHSFSEKDNQATFVLVIDELKVERKINNGFAKKPKNATIGNQIINEQAINFSLEIKEPKKTYRFEIKRLPTQINPEKTKFKFENGKVIIVLQKKINETWKTFAENDYETVHLVKN